MWESPISEIHEQLRIKYDDGVMMAVQEVGFNVDKEELQKALIYDRNQYEKGYADGTKENGWIPCSERLPKESDVSIVFNSFSETVLVTRKDLERGINVVSTDFVRDGDFPDYNGVYETIAWIPLPEPYKEDDKRMPYYYGWIPCSVILPEEEEEVIVSQCFHDGRNKVSIAHCFNGDNWFTDDPSYITDVVAWMPLPKPYKAGDEE